jgi:hypothetical protein
VSALEEEITACVRKLRPEQQRQLLEYVRSFDSEAPRGTPAERLRQFYGIWSKEDAEEIKRAIDEGAGRVRHGLRGELWRFRNTFTAEAAEEIKRDIEESCGRGNPDG